MGAQTGHFDHMLDDLMQRQGRSLRAQPLDQADKMAQRGARLAGQMRHGLVERRIEGARRILQDFKRTGTDAAGRKVHHPHEGRVVVRVGDQAQVGQRMLHLLALEEAQPAIHAVSHAARKKLMFQHPRLGVGTV